MAHCREIRHIRFSSGHSDNHRDYPHWVHRPGGTDLWILEYTVSGCGKIVGDGATFRVEPHDVIVFRPGICQNYGMDTVTAAWEHIWVCFTPRSTWYDWLRWPAATPGIQRLRIPQDVLRGRIIRLLKRVVEISHGPLRRREEFAMTALQEALLWCDTVNPAGDVALLDDRVQHAMQFFCDRIAEPTTLGEVAHAVGLSVSRFSHIFREEVGMAPMQYLEKQRIQRAGERLMMTSDAVADIANAVGYRNPFYFTNIFSRHMGCSPRAYRRSCSNRTGLE